MIIWLFGNSLRVVLIFGIIGIMVSIPLDGLDTIKGAFAQGTASESLQRSVAPDTSTNIISSSPGSSVRPPAVQKWGEPATVPTTVLPQASDPTVWGLIRHGEKGSVSIPNQRAALLVQSQGQGWRVFREQTLYKSGGWVILGVVIALVIFFLARGSIKISKGRSEKTIVRFKMLERFTHWLTAVPFIVLALTGLNLIYGKDLLLPILGPEMFSAITIGGKWLHNFMAFAFILGLILMVILWVRHNLWDKYDAGWIRTGGGMFSDDVHPPAKKFNTGQKVVFWAVILAGASISYSGIALMFPFAFEPFAGTFAVINLFGANLPTELEPIQEMQLLQAWHAIVAVILIGLIIAHVYIGSVGMEGAIDAMWTGEVDENWAREHHAAWVAELKGEPEPEPLSFETTDVSRSEAHD
ncbi:MAG: formate dehydrogenase subunit gamma [Pseudomonadota bacterium]|nr:formate dehydrogenase subunit gamma [Pseudomonadota bacterium]